MMAKPKKTKKFNSSREKRVQANLKLYGDNPRPLKPGCLPTNAAVDLAIEDCIIKESKKQNNKYNNFEAHAILVVLDSVIETWTSVSNISILERKSIQRKIGKLRERRCAELKNLSIDKRSGVQRKQGKYKKRKKMLGKLMILNPFPQSYLIFLRWSLNLI